MTVWWKRPHQKYVIVGVIIAVAAATIAVGVYLSLRPSQTDAAGTVSVRNGAMTSCNEQNASDPSEEASGADTSHEPPLSVEEAVLLTDDAGPNSGEHAESHPGPARDDDDIEPDPSFQYCHPPATLHLYTRDGRSYDNNEPRLDQLQSSGSFAVIVHTLLQYHGSSLFRAMMNPDVYPGRDNAKKCTLHEVELQHGRKLAIIDTPPFFDKLSTEDLESNREILAGTGLPLKRIYFVMDASQRYEQLRYQILALSAFYGPQTASKLVFIVNDCNRNVHRHPLQVLPHNIKLCFHQAFPNVTFREDQIVYVGWDQVKHGSARGWGQLFDDLSAAGQEADDLTAIPNFKPMKSLQLMLYRNVSRQKELKSQLFDIIESLFSRCAFHVKEPPQAEDRIIAATIRLLESASKTKRFHTVQSLLNDHLRRARETSQEMFSLCLMPLNATSKSSEALWPVFENLDAIANEQTPRSYRDQFQQPTHDNSPAALIQELRDLGRLAQHQFDLHFRSLFMSAFMYQGLHIDCVRALQDVEKIGQAQD